MALGVMAAVAQDRLVPAMRNLVSFLRVDRLARWVDADPISRLVLTPPTSASYALTQNIAGE